MGVKQILHSGFWHSFCVVPVTFDAFRGYGGSEHGFQPAGLSCQIFVLGCKVFAQRMWAQTGCGLRLLNCRARCLSMMSA
jgi:hypothetical protein